MSAQYASLGGDREELMKTIFTAPSTMETGDRTQKMGYTQEPYRDSNTRNREDVERGRYKTDLFEDIRKAVYESLAIRLVRFIFFTIPVTLAVCAWGIVPVMHSLFDINVSVTNVFFIAIALYASLSAVRPSHESRALSATIHEKIRNSEEWKV